MEVMGSASDIPGPTVDDSTAMIDVLWVPLGAGQRVVRTSGWIYEALIAAVQRRPRCALYHSALLVHLPEGTVVVEVAPVPDGDGASRGVVGEGAVGLRVLGRSRLFRYEVRRWLHGTIPDAHFATIVHHVEVPLERARHLLDLAPEAPTPVWGRDEFDVGDMWNSNSVTSWLLVSAGLDTSVLGPPPGGRGPGWDAGLAIGGRQHG